MDQEDSLPQRGTAHADRVSPLIRPAIGYFVAACCLVWVFHDIRISEVFRYAHKLRWTWVAFAILADILSYVCQAWRWRLLLRPVGKLSIASSTQAIYAGLFANEILPMRVGEYVRAYLVSRWLSSRISAIVPSMLVERLIDGIILTIGLVLSVSFISLPRNMLEAGDIFAVITLVSVAGFFFLVLPESDSDARTIEPEERLLAKLRGFFRSIAEGLRAIQSGRTLYQSFAISILYLSLQVFSFWLIMQGFGLGLSVWLGAVVFLVVHLGTAIPNAPANIGTYQFFTVIGLALFGVDKTLATSFSIVVFILLTVPLCLLGCLALLRSRNDVPVKLSFRENHNLGATCSFWKHQH